MITENYKKRIQELAGINSKYYRAETKFVGDNVVFKPNGYYEEIDDDGNPTMHFGEYLTSDIKETSASKYVGGAVMGAFSMSKANVFYIYEISESPDKDISHWSGGDFEFLDEIRYRRDVEGVYIGKVILEKNQATMLDCWYKFYARDEVEDDVEDNECNEFKNIDDFNDYIHKELKKIKPIK